MEEVPYCLARSSVTFRSHTGWKINDFDPNWAFPDCNSSLNSRMATKWYAQCLKWHRRNPLSLFKVTETENQLSGSDLSISRWQHKFEFMDGYAITHVVLRSMANVPYCFSRSSLIFQGHGLTNRFGSHLSLQDRFQLPNPSALP